MTIFKTVDEFHNGIHGIVEVLPDEKKVFVLNKERLWQDDGIDNLVRTAVFSPSKEVKELAYWVIREVGKQVGVYAASIQTLYDKMGAGDITGFTVPALNLRGPTYDQARAVIRAQKSLNGGPVLFEVAKSEMGYTEQAPAEYASCIIAAAIKEQGEEGYGPIFIQGDHFQVKAANYRKDKEAEVASIKKLIDGALAAGFYNIDIDTSTLVDLSYDSVDEQQKDNYMVSAELTKYIRENTPKGVKVSVGGEIGEVGSQNSNPEELRAYMDGLLENLDGVAGPSKISVQTGTAHGGVPAADGSIMEVNLDFDTLEKLSEIARDEYGMAGAVQHGASTLPNDLFHKFPEVGTAEIHLATGFQNLIMDHKRFPKKLREEMYAHLRKNHSSERKEGWTDEQFLYKLRKKAHGPFKQQLWDLKADVKDEIMKDLQGTFEFLFDKLAITGRREEVNAVFQDEETA